MRGTVILAGASLAPADLQRMREAAEREGINLVVPDPNAPDPLPCETWTDYAIRAGYAPPSPSKPSPIPAKFLRKSKRPR